MSRRLTRNQFRNAERARRLRASYRPNRSRGSDRDSHLVCGDDERPYRRDIETLSRRRLRGRAVAVESAGGGTRREVGKGVPSTAAESGLERHQEIRMSTCRLKRQPPKRVTGQSLAQANRQKPPASGGAGLPALLEMTRRRKILEQILAPPRPVERLAAAPPPRRGSPGTREAWVAISARLQIVS
jgi:hypothetical protein